MTYSNGQGGSAPSLPQRKSAARDAARAVLEQCDPVQSGQAVARCIARHVPPGGVVAAFYPFGRELDLVRSLRQLWAGSTTMALPRTPARGLPLSFHRWDEGDALLPERFGTATSSGPAVTPGVILVPLLAFDRRGHRLGYGGGFYDRTLAARPGAWAIGCAYAALELPEVPTGPTDRALHAIATETEFITVSNPPTESPREQPCASSS